VCSGDAASGTSPRTACFSCCGRGVSSGYPLGRLEAISHRISCGALRTNPPLGIPPLFLPPACRAFFLGAYFFFFTHTHEAEADKKQKHAARTEERGALSKIDINVLTTTTQDCLLVVRVRVPQAVSSGIPPGTSRSLLDHIPQQLPNPNPSHTHCRDLSFRMSFVSRFTLSYVLGESQCLLGFVSLRGNQRII